MNGVYRELFTTQFFVFMDVKMTYYGTLHWILLKLGPIYLHERCWLFGLFAEIVVFQFTAMFHVIPYCRSPRGLWTTKVLEEDI